MIRNRLLPHCYTADDELQVLGRHQQPALGPTIRCLVWNILKARRRAWAHDFTDLIHDRDLVMLQEAVINAPTDSLFTDSRRFEWVMARSYRHRNTEVENGVKTGCVASAVERHFYLSPHSEPVVNTQKLLLVTKYPLVDEDESLLVLNMHAINFVSVRKYVEQLDQLSDVLSQYNGPIILAGDFNTWNPQRLGHFLDISESAGLIEAVMERKGRLAHFNQHLDHVFYRGLELRVISSLAHFQSSDHSPITATFHRVNPGRNTETDVAGATT